MSQYFVDSQGRRHQLPDDATPAEIDSITRDIGTDPPTMTEAVNPLTIFTLGARNKALGLLPTIGGVAGGLIGSAGGPMAIGGAGVGGAAGEAAREALMGEKLSPGRIASEGGGQAIGEGVGGLMVKGAAKLARPLMRNALKLGKPIAGEVKVGSELYPDPVETKLLRQTGVNERGALADRALRKSKGNEIGSLLKKETAAGRQISTREVTKYARELLLDKSLPNKEKAKIFNELVTFYRERGARMDPELTQAIKRRYGGIYKGWDKGKDPLTDPTMGMLAREMNRGAAEALDVIPGMAKLNSEYAALKGAEKATEKAVRRPDPLWQAQAPTTYPIVRSVLGNRSLNAGIAKKLANPNWQMLYRQSPRLFFALLGQGTSAEPDVSAQ